jgi:asparagine synthase (glutamine-hydrolysing)
MCGIVGALGFRDGFAVDGATLTRMADTIAHRGPDADGAFSSEAERVGLGHRRLAIIDLSAAGRQPMANEDATVWLTYNGEVYNHGELRDELERRGHRYRSRTDSETIVHLYEELGDVCVERLHGMFALAIWDARRRRLLLARDRVGVKPLYFARLPDGIVFGSEIKAILAHPAITPDLDETAFFDYLTYGFVPPPATLYRGIEKLAPAETLAVEADGSMSRRTYWSPLDPETVARVAEMAEDEMIDEVRTRLKESIRKRMMADVPYGVFLSGGLDSSTNVALMSELTDQPVRTYSVAPRRHARYDERRYARLVAQRFSTDHHEVVIDEDDMRAFIPRMIHFQDEPLADPTSIPQHFVSKLARETGTIVIQVGEGADELFHGYHGYADHRRWVVPFQRVVPGPLRRPIGRAAVAVTAGLGRGVRHGEALYDASVSEIPYWGGNLCFRGPLKRAIGRNGHHADSHAVAERIWEEADRALPGADLYQRMTYLELKQRLAELLLMRLDRIAMASSIEGREPFLDHELVALAIALPPRMKYRDGTGKYALKRAMAGTLPAEILSRPKQGFGTPMPEWLRGDFGDQARREVRESSLAERELLDYERVERIFTAHRRGRGDWSKHIWNLYAVSRWHDRWISGRE